ncbi:MULTISPECIES: glycosyltransferase [unclassified Sphingomonas]|uniref:glycosyltransferase n=1 Tax=unclassified Sphingomonas TaxID=196159 RepID=UPI0006FF7487|nr:MULTISPECIES: glycosyltransferase [unclassified Sphingomonas]KQX19493.1 hypothetical protein ASD17_13295 [Sphingomonas sp. Root1294]KQY65694.1 hypothetical protein ASD39_16495 [Sphingomonas sp. Root50]KRB95002.1 hypothetical protein ASE22_03560 [Sphingomonas sp. Root720]
MKILHVITALNFGGAEAMLSKLISEHGGRAGFPEASVLSLQTPGTVGRQMIDSGVEVDTLHLHAARQLPAAMARLVRIVRRRDPDIVQGWMYHGNIVASVAAKLARGRPPLLWNIRHSLGDMSSEKWSSRKVIELGALLSSGPQATIYNSEAALRQHVAVGYDPAGALVIPNGFNDRHFQPDVPEGRLRAGVRRQFGIDPSPTLVAVVARHHPMKDHATAIEAVGRAREMGHDIHLLLAGSGTDALPARLTEACRRWLPEDRLTLLGDRRDVADWLPGCDVVALSSAWGEGFPNILGEAMASGVPCIATDVGDSRAIIDDAGLCVPRGNPVAMAEAIAKLVEAGPAGRRRMGECGRTRVQNEFSLPIVARRYADLYDDLYRSSFRKPSELEVSQCAG